MQTNLRSSRRARLTSAVMITALALSLFGNVRLTSIIMPTAQADTAYFNLAGGNFTQNWSNTGLITTNDDWSGVPSITGFLGRDDTTTATAVDPQTILAPRDTEIDVVANQTMPNTFTSGGIGEFEMTQQNAPAATDPTVALQGSGTADSPYLNIYLNTTGRTAINVAYNLRDIDGSADNAVQPVALQYRVGATGDYINIPAGFVADASARPSATADPSNATLVTPVSAMLPAAAENQSQVQVRIITSNALGSDELIGVDDINITSSPMGGTTPLTDSQTVYGVTAGNTLINFNTTTPGTVNTVGTITGITGSIIGIDFRPSGNSATRGLLYAVTNDGGTGRIYTINLMSAAATLRATLAADTANDTTPDYAGLTGTSFGVDFNPVPDRLRVVSNTGQNLRINVDTGATITDGTINPGTPSIVAVAYTNPDNNSTTGTTLYDIDMSTSPDTLYTQNPPNNGTLVLPAGSAVGNLGFDATAGGFDIARNGNGFAVMTVGGASNLYQINVTTGAATFGGAVSAAGGEVTGIAIADVAGGTITDSQLVYGVTAANQLVSFNTTSPGTVTTIATISGITGTIIGIDFRPSSPAESGTRRLLYAVTNDGGTGRIYTIDLQTGAATLRTTLVAAPVSLDPTPDYAGLTGTSFGVDFNPVPDRLRVVSNTGQNLRINVDTGATITDGTINPGTPSIVAVAYTNPDSDTTTGTALYDIDSTTDTLFIQNPPNDGTLMTIGALGVDASEVAGFDIGRASATDVTRSGNAFAVLTVGGSQGLYEIVLGSGRAIFGGSISSSPPVTSGATTSGAPSSSLIGIAIADLSPTADTVTIAGRVTTPYGTPISGVTVRLSGSQQAIALTDADGGYNFESVEVGGIYTVAASGRGYRFASSSFTFGDVQANTVADFVASPIKGRTSRSRFSR